MYHGRAGLGVRERATLEYVEETGLGFIDLATLEFIEETGLGVMDRATLEYIAGCPTRCPFGVQACLEQTGKNPGLDTMLARQRG